MRSEEALVTLLAALKARGYSWITPTPATQQRVLDRPDRRVGSNLADIFGWSLPFPTEAVDSELLGLMRAGDIVTQRGHLLASTMRVSSLDDRLFLHSAYPTTAGDAVFFGPDTYRFARFVAQAAGSARRLADIGCGSGAGAVVAARASGAEEIVMSDVNPGALRLARINAAASGLAASGARMVFASSDVLRGIEGMFDLVISNPPYLVDDEQRVYRHGGEMLGAGLSLRIAREAAERLNPGGRLLLYTASAIVRGVDAFADAVVPMLHAQGCTVAYEEIDPDVFGEELERPAYRHVDRIAVVGVVARKSTPNGGLQ